MSIIAISGKLNSGKDTVATIIQYLTTKKEDISYSGSYNSYVMDLGMGGSVTSNWQIKRFADKVKDIVCLLINCTREQLEDRKFKEAPLREEWRVWYWSHYKLKSHSEDYRLGKIKATKEEAQAEQAVWSPNFADGKISSKVLTPRSLLQLVGTNAGRDIIHPNLWVNSLFNEYIMQPHSGITRDLKLPNWIIPDMRFSNEVKAVKEKGGLIIRVERYSKTESTHESETALDNTMFENVIINNGSIEDLIYKVRELLIKDNII